MLIYKIFARRNSEYMMTEKKVIIKLISQTHYYDVAIK